MLTKDFYTQLLPGRTADPGQAASIECPPAPPASSGLPTGAGGGSSGGGTSCQYLQVCVHYVPCDSGGPHESGDTGLCCDQYELQMVC
jgi:hypothetical protein